MKLGLLCKHRVALETLLSLLAAGYQPAFVIVQERFSAGDWYGELEILCAEHQVPFRPVHRIREEEHVDFLRATAPDLIVSVLYTEIIPQQIIDIPPLGVINHHPSMLPAYRGPHPVNWAVINGEAETGLTVHLMNAAVDAGDILWQRLVPIGFEDTLTSLSQRIMALVPQAALDVVRQIEAGTARRRRQDEALASYFPRRTEQDDIVDWRRSARQVYDLIRGLCAPPLGAVSWLNGWRVVLREAKPGPDAVPPGTVPGTILEFTPKEIVIATGVGVLMLSRIDLDGETGVDACLALGSFAQIGDRFTNE